jgi:serine/threonine-protein kinase
MSPEQLIGGSMVDARADLWSLAVVAYSCLTGKLPFAGETMGAVCLAIHNGTFIDPSTHRSGLPATLDAWFRKALDRAPGERFASAAEMSAAFSVAVIRDPTAPPLASASALPLVNSTTTAYLLTQPKRQRPRKRRFVKTVVSLLGVATLLLVALGTWEPELSPDWAFAGRLGRTLAGALGRRATSFANSGPPPTPVAGAPRGISLPVDANAPELVVPPPPLATRPAPDTVTRSAPARVVTAHPQAPAPNELDSATTVIPNSPEEPRVAQPSPAPDNPYEP